MTCNDTWETRSSCRAQITSRICVLFYAEGLKLQLTRAFSCSAEFVLTTHSLAVFRFAGWRRSSRHQPVRVDSAAAVQWQPVQLGCGTTFPDQSLYEPRRLFCDSKELLQDMLDRRSGRAHWLSRICSALMSMSAANLLSLGDMSVRCEASIAMHFQRILVL